MAETVRTDSLPMMLHLRPAMEMDDERLFEFCRINREWRIERSVEGELEIMPPTGGYTSDRNSEINFQLRLWALRYGTGVAFESNGGFVLPNGAMRSPDASWVSRKRLSDFTAEQKRKFLPLCPDFVIELRSSSDRLTDIQDKMNEYIENGAELGWLIDPEERKVHVYTPDEEVKILERPERLSGNATLPDFALDLKSIWEPGF